MIYDSQSAICSYIYVTCYKLSEDPLKVEFRYVVGGVFGTYASLVFVQNLDHPYYFHPPVICTPAKDHRELSFRKDIWKGKNIGLIPISFCLPVVARTELSLSRRILPGGTRPRRD